VAVPGPSRSYKIKEKKVKKEKKISYLLPPNLCRHSFPNYEQLSGQFPAPLTTALPKLHVKLHIMGCIFRPIMPKKLITCEAQSVHGEFKVAQFPHSLSGTIA